MSTDTHIRVLLLEDDHHDAVLIENELQKSGLSLISERIESKEEFLGALRSFRPDVILSDFSMPAFDGLSALELVREHAPGIPFIFVSGTLGEEKAIEALKKGATDYVLKDKLGRLGASVLRALREAGERRERQEAEAQLRSNQELFRLITENVADLIAVLDLQGRRLYNSPSYAQILGDTGSLHGSDSFREIHPDDREKVRQIFLDTVAEGKGRRAEYRFIAKDGSIRHIESHGSVIRGPDGKVTNVVVVSRDLTERRESEKEKELLEDQLRQAQKMESIGTLAGGVAHDFNNILSIIIGYTNMLERKPPSPQLLEKGLTAISTAAWRGSALVKQLMTFARKSDVEFVSVNVNKVIDELSAMLTATFPRTIEFEMNLARDIPEIVADPTQLHQALLNLCVNARDAMATKGVLTITTERIAHDVIGRQFPSAEPGDHVGIHIKDTGVGMDEPTRQRIFEPFFTTKEHGKGTGLGLAVVYGVVKGHNGVISVETKPGLGTTFHIYLPVVHPSGVASPAPDQELTQIRGGTETILFVEDEEMLIDLVESLLTANGYSVLVARTGREAVEMYRDDPKGIALVLSDLGLPELPGNEAYIRMREINPQVKAVFATGYLDAKEMDDLLRMGAMAIVQKPYVPFEILKTIRVALDTPLGEFGPRMNPENTD